MFKSNDFPDNLVYCSGRWQFDVKCNWKQEGNNLVTICLDESNNSTNAVVANGIERFKRTIISQASKTEGENVCKKHHEEVSCLLLVQNFFGCTNDTKKLFIKRRTTDTSWKKFFVLHWQQVCLTPPTPVVHNKKT